MKLSQCVEILTTSSNGIIVNSVEKRLCFTDSEMSRELLLFARTTTEERRCSRKRPKNFTRSCRRRMYGELRTSGRHPLRSSWHGISSRSYTIHDLACSSWGVLMTPCIKPLYSMSLRVGIIQQALLKDHFVDPFFHNL